jgi:hypothetical protein
VESREPQYLVEWKVRHLELSCVASWGLAGWRSDGERGQAGGQTGRPKHAGGINSETIKENETDYSERRSTKKEVKGTRIDDRQAVGASRVTIPCTSRRGSARLRILSVAPASSQKVLQMDATHSERRQYSTLIRPAAPLRPFVPALLAVLPIPVALSTPQLARSCANTHRTPFAMAFAPCTCPPPRT